MSNNFFTGFTPLPTPPQAEPQTKDFRVHLFRTPHLIRGWLAYLGPDQSHCTVTVSIPALTGAKAANAAITAANKQFTGCRVIRVHRGKGDLWDANNFKELDGLAPAVKEVQP